MNERIVVGVDIGTTKVCAIIASHNTQGQINILGIGVAESEGLNRGVVVNIEKTVLSVQKAVREAERSADVKVQSVVVGIAGDHIQSLQSRSVVTVANRSDNEITRDDVQRLIDDARQIHMPAGREILHVIPQEYIVDGHEGVQDPVGMSGVRLEGNVHIISGLVTAANNIHKCIERAGYEVAALVFEPLASSYAVLYPDEREVGVALIDIGGGTTDIAVFEEHTIRHTAVIPVAGTRVTDDIRIGLGILRDQAERLKCRYGTLLVDEQEPDQDILVQGIGDRPVKPISQSVLTQIIQPRLEEILEAARGEIQNSGFATRLGAGVVLTGGGSMIPGISELATAVLGHESRVGQPLGIGGGLVTEVQNPKFATAVGLVMYAITPEVFGGHAIKGPMGIWSSSLQPPAEEPASTPSPSQPSHSSPPEQTSRESVLSRIGQKVKVWFDEL